MGNVVSSSGPPSPPSSDGTVLLNPPLTPAGRPSSTDVSPDQYPSWKTATLELSSNGTTEWVFFARGSSSAGHVRFVESTTGKAEVVVHVGYAAEGALDTLNVCLLAKGDDVRGVGVYTPHRIHVPRNPLYIHTVIHLPAGSSMHNSAPSHVMTTFTSNTSYHLSLPSACPLTGLNIQTSNGSILFSSPVDVKGDVTVRTSNASIKGSDMRCEALKVITSNASIEFGRVSSRPSTSLPLAERTRQRMEFVTSNAPVRLPSIDVPTGSVECKVESSNKPISITFKPVETPTGPDKSHLDVRSSGSQGVLLSGLDLGEGGANKLKRETDGRIWGHVGPTSGEGSNGSIDVASSNARVGITFGP
ncbi:hypothetical protein [Phaffia rhodozyma]|uniref:Adhesin domain-containing protein n=1 Tax=Phaffia rhodozyma TaxID=264483 RepID=A0A0F7SF37_PHARH|nr:hypothetical protein [Phaffia rhodozyma]